MELLIVLASAVVSFIAHHGWKHHPDYDLVRVLDRRFAELRFPLRDGGTLPGSEVRVLQRPVGIPASVRQVGGALETEGFWYCAGPEGHFWMAIAQCERQWLLWQVSWIVRPLTAQRLRNALFDKPQALQLAFGHVDNSRVQA